MSEMSKYNTEFFPPIPGFHLLPTGLATGVLMHSKVSSGDRAHVTCGYAVEYLCVCVCVCVLNKSYKVAAFCVLLDISYRKPEYI